MPVLFSNTFFSLVVASVLLAPLPPALALETHDSLSLTLEKTVQFPDLEGEEILVPAGDYSVKAGVDQLTLTGSNSQAITIEAHEGSHSTEISTSSVVFLSSEEEDTPKTHALIVYYPTGKTLEALGHDPTVTSRGTMEPTAEDLAFVDPVLVTFNTFVHFTGPDGNPIVVQPETYTAEASEKFIRLIPSENSQNPLVIEAQQGTHETELEDFLALSFPGTTPKELDLHHVMLLLPDGKSLEATGSYSGIHTRNWFKRTFNKAKKTVNRTYKKVKKTRAFKKVNQAAKQVGKTANQAAKQVGKTAKQGTKIIGSGVKQGVSATKWAAGQAGKGIVQGAHETWKGMKWVAGQASYGACLAFFKGQEVIAKASEGAMKVVMKEVDKVRRNSKLINDVVKEVEKIQKMQQQIIDHAVKSSLRYMDPRMLNGLKDVVKFENICKNGIAKTQQKVKALFGQNQVRSRGVLGTTTSIGIQGAGTFKIGGLEGGMGRAWNSKAQKTYWFAGGTAQLPQLSGSVLVQIGRWQSLDSLTKGYLAAGVTIPLYQWAKIAGWVPGEQGVPGFKGGGGKSINITIDFMFGMDFTKKKPFNFAGIVVSPGVSASLANTKLAAGPLGAVTIQSGYGGFIKSKP